MRIGDSHREVAIILVGAMSRWVNNLEEKDLDIPRTKLMLKALRGCNYFISIQHDIDDYVRSKPETGN